MGQWWGSRWAVMGQRWGTTGVPTGQPWGRRRFPAGRCYSRGRGAARPRPPPPGHEWTAPARRTFRAPERPIAPRGEGRERPLALAVGGRPQRSIGQRRGGAGRAVPLPRPRWGGMRSSIRGGAPARRGRSIVAVEEGSGTNHSPPHGGAPGGTRAPKWRRGWGGGGRCRWSCIWSGQPPAQTRGAAGERP